MVASGVGLPDLRIRAPRAVTPQRRLSLTACALFTHRRSAITGAWSEGRSSLRGSTSMVHAVQRARKLGREQDVVDAQPQLRRNAIRR